MGISETVSGEKLESGFEDRPDHRISLGPAPRPMVVEAFGQKLVETDRAVLLKEADYPPVRYYRRVISICQRSSRPITRAGARLRGARPISRLKQRTANSRTPPGRTKIRFRKSPKSRILCPFIPISRSSHRSSADTPLAILPLVLDHKRNFDCAQVAGRRGDL